MILILWHNLTHNDCKCTIDIFENYGNGEAAKCLLCGAPTLYEIPDHRTEHRFFITKDEELINFIKGLF